jgi:hypothetical protein
VHKSTKGRGAKGLRRGAITGIKNPNLLPSAPRRKGSAPGRQSLSKNGNIARFDPKITFLRTKALI